MREDQVVRLAQLLLNLLFIFGPLVGIGIGLYIDSKEVWVTKTFSAYMAENLSSVICFLNLIVLLIALIAFVYLYTDYVKWFYELLL